MGIAGVATCHRRTAMISVLGGMLAILKFATSRVRRRNDLDPSYAGAGRPEAGVPGEPSGSPAPAHRTPASALHTSAPAPAARRMGWRSSVAVRAFQPVGARFGRSMLPQDSSIVGAHTEGSGMISYGVNQNWAGRRLLLARRRRAGPRWRNRLQLTASPLPLFRLADHLWLEHLRRGQKARRDQRAGARDRGCGRIGSNGSIAPGSLGAA